jgi:hypothetical protein
MTRTIGFLLLGCLVGEWFELVCDLTTVVLCKWHIGSMLLGSLVGDSLSDCLDSLRFLKNWFYDSTFFLKKLGENV